MRAGVVALAGACVALGLAPGVLFAPLAELEPWAPEAPSGTGLDLPGTGTLPTGGIALALVAIVALLAILRGSRAATPAPTWTCGQLLGPELAWTSAGFSKPLRLVLEPLLRPERSIVVHVSGGVVQDVSYTGRVPHLVEERVYRPVTRIALAGGCPRRQAAERAAFDVRRVLDRDGRRAVGSRAARGDRMTAHEVVSAVAQVGGASPRLRCCPA